MTRILFHSSDASRRPRAFTVEGAAGWATGALVVAAGTVATLGLFGAPDLIADLSRQADRLSLRETARVGREAFESVRLRHGTLAQRLGANELLIARVAVAAGVPLPEGFPSAPPDGEPRSAADLELDVGAVARQLRGLETFRRAIAAAPPVDASRIPSRSPVEPSTAVPTAVFGPRVSPLTHHPEFVAGLALAVPNGVAVTAPAAGTVGFVGRAPGSVGAAWRRLGTVLVLVHDERTRTVYGHLGKVLVRRGQKVRRGELLARAGQSGLAPAPTLHYQVQKLEKGRFVPVDPRLYVLDADWITAAQVRSRPVPPEELELPPALR